MRAAHVGERPRPALGGWLRRATAPSRARAPAAFGYERITVRDSSLSAGSRATQAPNGLSLIAAAILAFIFSSVVFR